MKYLAIAAMIFTVTGCINTKIVERGKDRYLLNTTDMSGMMLPCDVEAKALELAKEHCKKQGKQLETEKSENGGVPIVWVTHAQVHFRCMSSARAN